MSFYRTNNPVAININMVAINGTPINGLSPAQVQIILIKSGITQNISNLYTFSEQQNGIYRVVFDASLMTEADVDYVLIAHDTTSQAMDDKLEFTLYDESVDSSYTKLIAEINQIPTNPILETNPILFNMDAPISSMSTLTSQEVWTYQTRLLTGVSGVNQINVNDFMSQYMVNEDLYLNVNMIDTNNNPVSGLSYTGPGSGTMDIILYKGGVKQALDTLTVGVTGLEEGVYRVRLDKVLMDTPKIDYVLMAKDLTYVALTDKINFSLFEVVGLEGAYQATITVRDSNTNLSIPDTQVYVKNSDQTLLINKGIIGIDGIYTVGLGVGDYKVILKKSFTDFTIPETMTVTSSGNNTFTFYGSGFSASSPTSPSTCVVYGWVTDISGNEVKGAKVTATEPNNSRYSGTNKIVKVTKSTTTDINGYFELELIQSALLSPTCINYKIDITYPGFSYTKNITVPSSSTAEFSTL